MVVKNHIAEVSKMVQGVIIMMQYSKEWYEAVEFFERTADDVNHKSYRFDKEKRGEAPVGNWYQHGETNDAFRMFLSGIEYARMVDRE
jgi:hypothetical protein